MRDNNQNLRTLQQQVLRQPNNLDALRALGTAYLEHGNHSGALDCFRRMTTVQPDSPPAYCALGWALLHVGDLDGARNAYTKACKLAPWLAQAVSGKVDVLYRLGDLKGAYQCIRILLDSGREDPGGSVAAARVYARICHEYGECSEACRLLGRMVKNPRISNSGRVSAGFALGALYDRLERYAEAFASYQQANSLAAYQYSHALECAKNDSIIGAFSAGKLAKIACASNNSDQPVFIIGMPRSGTSLVEQILARHPEVHSAGELNTITEIANVLVAQCGYPATLNGLGIDVLDKAADHYLKQVSQLSSGSERVTDKMPANFMHLGLIYLLFPKAHIIHVCRNPMDTCLSIYFQTFGGTHAYSTDLRNIGLYYREYLRLMAHWKSVLSMDIHEIRYEELVANQESVSRSMVEFCGLEWNKRCLEFYKTDRVVTTASHDQVNKALYNSSVDRWKHYEPFIGPLIDVLGSQPPG